MKSNLTLFILGTVLVLGILGGIGYLATKDSKEGDDQLVVPVATTTDSGSNTDSTPGYTIEVIPDTIKDIQPNLDRGIKFGATIPADARVALQGQADKLIARLKVDPTKGGDWLNLGLVYHSANDFEGARDVWLFLLKVLKAPDTAMVYDNLGKLYKFDLKDYVLSEQYFKKSMQSNPKSTIPYIELFGLYRDLYKTNTTAAPDILLAAVSKFPADADPLALLGGYYRDRGDYPKARDYFTRALKIVQASGDTARANAIQAEIDALPK